MVKSIVYHCTREWFPLFPFLELVEHRGGALALAGSILNDIDYWYGGYASVSWWTTHVSFCSRIYLSNGSGVCRILCGVSLCYIFVIYGIFIVVWWPSFHFIFHFSVLFQGSMFEACWQFLSCLARSLLVRIDPLVTGFNVWLVKIAFGVLKRGV